MNALDYRFDRSSQVTCLRFPLLEAVPGVRHAITTRLGGLSRGPYSETNLGLSVGDDSAAVLANRALATRLVTSSDAHPVTVRQVHGVAAAYAFEPGQPGVPLAAADMLATDRGGVPLLVQSADCLAVVLIDPHGPAVAVVHAGWRGVAAYAGRECVASMQRFFGSRPERLFVGAGPGIGICCYEVGEDVALAVARTCGGTDGLTDFNRGPRPYLDIQQAFVSQLVRAGVPRSQVAVANLCTGCNPEFFYSHRCEGVPSGRFGALVAIS